MDGGFFGEGGERGEVSFKILISLMVIDLLNFSFSVNFNHLYFFRNSLSLIFSYIVAKSCS